MSQSLKTKSRDLKEPKTIKNGVIPDEVQIWYTYIKLNKNFENPSPRVDPRGGGPRGGPPGWGPQGWGWGPLRVRRAKPSAGSAHNMQDMCVGTSDVEQTPHWYWVLWIREWWDMCTRTVIVIYSFNNIITKIIYIYKLYYIILLFQFVVSLHRNFLTMKEFI